MTPTESEGASTVPRIRIDVNEAWLKRLQQVLPAAIDTLTGWEHQIQSSMLEGTPDARDLLDSLHQQIRDLRRTIETVRVIF